MVDETERGGIWTVAIAVVLAAAATGYWYLRDRPTPVLAPAPSVQPELPPVAEAPAVAHPIEQAAVQASELVASAADLPALHESDMVLLEALAGLFGADAMQAMLNPEYIVQRMVVTIDNLPQQKLAPRLLPLKPVPGRFETGGDGVSGELGNENAARYDRHVALLSAVDTQALVALYVHYYPLFQQAYDELGVPGRYFNDRVIEVVDHLLAAPATRPPYALNRVGNAWQFADPRLEGMSAGHRAMLRIGPEHATTVKAKLREIRDALLGHPPPRSEPVAEQETAPGA